MKRTAIMATFVLLASVPLFRLSPRGLGSIIEEELVFKNRSQMKWKDFESISRAPSPEEINNNSMSIEEAIEQYREQVLLAMPGAKRRDEMCRVQYKNVDVQPIKICLPASSDLKYPTDAEEHFNEIRLALARWSQHAKHRYHGATGYHGPWIENDFTHRQERKYAVMVEVDGTAEHDTDLDGDDDDGIVDNWCLTDIYGSYIPILVPWTDIWVNSGHFYPGELVDSLLEVVRPNVPYVVVVQHDEGWGSGSAELAIDKLQNNHLSVTIMSAGGYGHVPVPLLKADMTNLRDDLNISDPVAHMMQIKDRSYLTSYVGSLINAPRDLRKKTHEKILELSSKTAVAGNTTLYKYHYGEGWTDVMLDSKFSLVPRGFGRTAYHLVETLQLGLIPVYVYSDTPWVPYGSLLTEGPRLLVYVTDFDGVPTLTADVLSKVSDEDIRWRERRILELRRTHFTMPGVLDQIDHYLLHDGESDLRCRAVPSTVRDA